MHGRYFISHDIPVGATHARLRCEVFATRTHDALIPA